MSTCHLTPLTAEAFAPFGDVFAPEAVTARVDHVARAENLRPGARPNQFLARAALATLPHGFTRMECHPFSSQSFVPFGPAPVLVVVAQPGADGGPDLSTLRAFRAVRQGFNYRPGVWHLGVASLGDAVPVLGFMFEDGTAEDCVFAAVPPCRVEAG